ncbi:MAG: DUF364 domain-containing protein [Actinomycetota bacterium]|nr:DUF364 domain-containing protein [Actinomycetota bacterium]
MSEEACKSIASRIAAAADEAGGGRRIRDAVIGLGYTMIRLEDGSCGLAYTLREGLQRGCETFGAAGTLIGRELRELLPWMESTSVISSALALAAANAVLSPPHDAHSEDLLRILSLQPGEKVVTVGRFKPMEQLLEEKGIHVEVVEWGDPIYALDDCDIALITATTIINNTLEGLLRHPIGAREVVLLGPSTPYAPSALLATPVTLLAGSVVGDPERARRVVCEGGGTQTMGKALLKWAARVRRP